ncbi:hypothetical protein GGS23DRAFT_613517, partial [Durotheca rogersii]|uniref:uncharacterized protein n=1 Tax=Durotheca rogersii TaxID=419775 RepID=UPI002220037E
MSKIFGAQDGKTDTSKKSEKSVHEMLYGERSFNDIIDSLDHGNSEVPLMCRWFHPPENNMAWVNEEEISRLFKRFRKYADRLEEPKLLEDVKDIRDKIEMIQCVHKDQAKVIAEVKNFLQSEEPKLRSTVNDIAARFKVIDDHAKSVESSPVHLEKKRRKQQDKENLPLSFMNSFLAISVAQFPHDQESGDISWPLSYLCGLLFGVSFAVIIPLILLAFNIKWLTAPWTTFREVWLCRLMLNLLSFLKRFRGFRPLAAWGNEREQHLVLGLIDYFVGYNVGDEMINHLKHIIASDWGASPANVSGAGLDSSSSISDGLRHLIYRSYKREDEDVRVSIASSTMRGILGDNASDDESVDDEDERRRDYKKLEKAVPNRY